MPKDGSLHAADELVRRYAPEVLAALNVKSLAKAEVRSLDWADLSKVARVAGAAVRNTLDKVDEKTIESEARARNDAAEALLELLADIDQEKDVRTELDERGPRTKDSPREMARPGGATRSAPAVDRFGPADWDDHHATSIDILKPEQRMADWAKDGGLPGPELSLGSYLTAMVRGARTEAEKRALAEGSDSAGGFTVPTPLAIRLIDLVRSNLVTVAAGAQTLPMTANTLAISRVETDPVPAWRLENSQVSESDPTFGQIQLTAKSLAVLVKASREVVEDSNNIGTQLPNIIAAAMARELDRVALFGSGTDPEPLGIANTAGIDEIAHNGPLINFTQLVNARTNLLSANHTPNAIIAHPRDEGTYVGLTDGDGQPLMMPAAVSSIPMLTTTSVPTDGGVGTNESMILMGDFSRLMLGIRSEVRIEILRETFADRLQYGFLAHLRADVVLEHRAAFSKITGIQPAA